MNEIAAFFGLFLGTALAGAITSYIIVRIWAMKKRRVDKEEYYDRLIDDGPPPEE